MPKERKQRGRRKKKTEGDNETADVAEHFVADMQNGMHNETLNGYNGEVGDERSSEFFGLLDESEQNYFKTIDDAMVADEFASIEERDVFVENVYKEAENKELKLATSPLGSKVLEQLLARSKPAQVRQLFKCFQGQFHSLVRHRYASHVCEMLFAVAATLVSSEMANTAAIPASSVDDEVYVSTENLFLYMINEVSPDLAALGADIYASHVVRDLLLILYGNLFTFEEAKGQSKRYHGQKKFSWARPERNLPVPPSFRETLRTTMKHLSTLPAAQLRMTAAQAYSVSFVQVLVSLESSTSEQDERPILFTLLGSEDLKERDDYIESILREPSGSKLFETIVDAVPESHFDTFYNTYFAGRTVKFAHNPITNFVLQRMISSVQQPVTLSTIVAELSPVFRELVEVNHMQIIQKLVEASIRLSCEHGVIFEQIKGAFGLEDDSNELVTRILDTPTPLSTGNSDRPPRRQLESIAGKTFNMQGAFLVKTLLQLPDEYSIIVASSITETSPEILLSYSKSHAAVKVLESFLESTKTTVLQRKRVLNAFFGHFVELSCDATASRFVDLCWSATGQIKLYKDRIAQELLEQADEVRGNYYGRIVWRNWNMDLFKNKRGEWNHLIKQELAKGAAMAKLSFGKPVETVRQKPAEVGMNAARAVLIQDAGAKKARQKIKRQAAVEDEVDDIFNRKKQRV